MNTLKNHPWTGFGFEIILPEVEVYRTRRSDEILMIKYSEVVPSTLLEIKEALDQFICGNQFIFIRLAFNMTRKQFSDLLGISETKIIEFESLRQRKFSLRVELAEKLKREIDARYGLIDIGQFICDLSAVLKQELEDKKSVSVSIFNFITILLLLFALITVARIILF